MIVTLDRFGPGSKYPPGTDSTVGLLTAGDVSCYTLEDEYRAVKVWGETRIPAGTYRLGLRTAGGMHPKYAKRFGAMHEGMIWIQDIPTHEWVYLHMGVNADHTAGCPLTGEHIIRASDGNYTLGRSEVAYRRIYPPIRDAIKAGETWIEVRDGLVPLPVVPIPSPIRR